MNYLETKLNTIIETVPFEDTSGFPNYILWAYRLEVITLHGADFLRITPREKRDLTNLKKDYAKISLLTDMHCIFQISDLTWYAEKRLIEEHISFYIPGGLIYIPFAGLFIPNKKDRPAKKYSRLSPIAQCILLSALYKGWQKKYLSEIAPDIGVSRMSVSRAFDEIAFYLPSFIHAEGNRRCFAINRPRDEYYHLIEQTLRNPVAKIYSLGSLPDTKLRYGGVSAISKYSMLNDNGKPIFALSTNEAKGVDLSKYGIVPDEEEPECIVQVMRYIIDYDDNTAIDPLSAILSLSNEERADPRIDAATEEMVGRIIDERN